MKYKICNANNQSANKLLSRLKEEFREKSKNGFYTFPIGQMLDLGLELPIDNPRIRTIYNRTNRTIVFMGQTIMPKRHIVVGQIHASHIGEEEKVGCLFKFHSYSLEFADNEGDFVLEDKVFEMFSSVDGIEELEYTLNPFNQIQMLFTVNGLSINLGQSQNIANKKYRKATRFSSIGIIQFMNDNQNNIEILRAEFGDDQEKPFESKIFFEWAAVEANFLMEKLTTWEKVWRFCKKQYKALGVILGVITLIVNYNETIQKLLP